ncbi:MAG: hypothetical protein J6Z26_05350 [Bacteroidales bacterium]|nr:hypothetical protein [Bacteroidales bacterium]MBP5759358.1 hypothetical protein [Bacteroidales bacterium]
MAEYRRLGHHWPHHCEHRRGVSLHFRPNSRTLRHDGPAAYFSTLPVKEMRDATLSAGLAAEISNSAGTYVCNHTMYECLYRIEHSGLKTRAGFVHVPQLKEDGAIGLDEMVKAVNIAIETIKQ